jgi:hypothetical protein
VVTPVNRDVRTLADVRDRLLASIEASTNEVKLQLSAINTVSRVSGCAPDDLPAGPAQLRGHLAAISPRWLVSPTAAGARSVAAS